MHSKWTAQIYQSNPNRIRLVILTIDFQTREKKNEQNRTGRWRSSTIFILLISQWTHKLVHIQVNHRCTHARGSTCRATLTHSEVNRSNFDSKRKEGMERVVLWSSRIWNETGRVDWCVVRFNHRMVNAKCPIGQRHAHIPIQQMVPTWDVMENRFSIEDRLGVCVCVCLHVCSMMHIRMKPVFIDHVGSRFLLPKKPASHSQYHHHKWWIRTKWKVSFNIDNRKCINYKWWNRIELIGDAHRIKRVGIVQLKKLL